VCLLVELAMPATMVGVPKGTLATETTNAMVRFMSGAMPGGMVRVPIALVLAVDLGFNL
jgi:hypothetical protein